MSGLHGITAGLATLGSVWLPLASALALMAALVVLFGVVSGARVRSVFWTAALVPSLSTVTLVGWLGTSSPGLGDRGDAGPWAVVALGAWAVAVIVAGAFLGALVLVALRRSAPR